MLRGLIAGWAGRGRREAREGKGKEKEWGIEVEASRRKRIFSHARRKKKREGGREGVEYSAGFQFRCRDALVGPPARPNGIRPGGMPRIIYPGAHRQLWHHGLLEWSVSVKQTTMQGKIPEKSPFPLQLHVCSKSHSKKILFINFIKKKYY
jgi:hypothetical protein